jgi:membrane protein DedA with SNARE-associated domain
MLHQFLNTWFQSVQDWGYLGIILLMAMESSIFPVPSEIVIPPAAFLAGQGKLDFWGVIAAGTVGSWLGSAITYTVARGLEQVALKKWGKLFFITEEKLRRAEHFVHRYEAGGIFFARLLPVVRHLISIPAGMLKMRFGIFSVMTVVGSFVWCTVLAWYGKGVADRHPEAMSDPDKLVKMIQHESVWLVAGIAVLCVLYFLMLRLTGRPGKAGGNRAA